MKISTISTSLLSGYDNSQMVDMGSWRVGIDTNNKIKGMKLERIRCNPCKPWNVVIVDLAMGSMAIARNILDFIVTWCESIFCNKGHGAWCKMATFSWPGSWDLKARYSVQNPATLRAGVENGEVMWSESKCGVKMALLARWIGDIGYMWYIVHHCTDTLGDTSWYIVINPHY